MARRKHRVWRFMEDVRLADRMCLPLDGYEVAKQFARDLIAEVELCRELLLRCHRGEVPSQLRRYLIRVDMLKEAAAGLPRAKGD